MEFIYCWIVLGWDIVCIFVDDKDGNVFFFMLIVWCVCGYNKFVCLRIINYDSFVFIDNEIIVFLFSSCC